MRSQIYIYQGRNYVSWFSDKWVFKSRLPETLIIVVILILKSAMYRHLFSNFYIWALREYITTHLAIHIDVFSNVRHNKRMIHLVACSFDVFFSSVRYISLVQPNTHTHAHVRTGTHSNKTNNQFAYLRKRCEL